MPVKRTRISRQQSLPTISEAHGGAIISSFPIPEIKGAPQEVAPFEVGPVMPTLIERDGLQKTNRERRMGCVTKEEREAKRKAKKEKKRAEKRRAKELEAAKSESSAMAIDSDVKDPVPGSFPSPRKSPKRGFSSPKVSLDDAIRKQEEMAAMDFSKLPMPPTTEDSEDGTTEGNHMVSSGNGVADAHIKVTEEIDDEEGNQLISSTAATQNDFPVLEISNDPVSMIFDQNDHKVQSFGSNTTLIASEVDPITEESRIEAAKSQLVGAVVGQKSLVDNKAPQVPGDSTKVEPVTADRTQSEQDTNDEESAQIGVEVERLLMPAEKDVHHTQELSNSTIDSESSSIIVETSLIPAETVQKPSDFAALMFATKGPSFCGSLDETTVEISQSSSDNDFDESNLLIAQVPDPNNDTTVYESECFETSADVERNMRRISIRRASISGPRPDYPDSSDDEEVLTPGATSITRHASLDSKHDRPILVRRESKSNLRKFRQGPQVLTTSAFGIVRLSDQRTLESSFIGEHEEIVADDDILVHAFRVEDDLANESGKQKKIQHILEATEDTSSNARGSPCDEASELIVQEKNESQRGWIVLIILLLTSGLAAGIAFAVTRNAFSSGLQSTSSDEPISIIPSQPSTGVLKYDPPTAKECDIIESGGTLEGEDELLRRDFDLLIDIELMNGFAFGGAVALLSDLQEGVNKYLIPHLTGCDDISKDRSLRGQSPSPRRLANARYVIANANAIVQLDETRSCEMSTAANCHAVKMSLQLRLKGEEKDFPITNVVSQSLDENNSLRRILRLSAPFREAIVTDIISKDPTTVQTVVPTESPSYSPTIEIPTESPSVSPTSR